MSDHEKLLISVFALLNISSGRMAIVLATFILAAQEILDLLYLALLFMSDRTELNSLVAKNACYAPQGISQSSLCQSRRDKQ